MKVISSKPLFLRGVLLLVFFLSAGPVISAPVPSTNPHAHFRQPEHCPKCHIYAGKSLEPGRVTASSIDYCLECHLAEEGGITHPLKVRPGDRYRGVGVPQDYRLSDDGRIICLTCHTAHGPSRSAVRVHAAQLPDESASSSDSPPGYKTYFLRRSDPGAPGFEPLCGGCHKAP